MSEIPKVNYNQIAPNYHTRYSNSSHSGTAQALRSLVHNISPKVTLDVGCGTGRWLAELQALVPHVIGLDFSTGMLQQAQQNTDAILINGDALHLPFADTSFDYVQCLHALHHFGNPEQFLDEAFRILKQNGTLVIVHLIPPTATDNWYVYQYFEGTYEIDVARYPAFGKLLDGVIQRGAQQASWQIVERFERQWIGSDVFNDPFIKKDSTSQLILLTDEAYEAGLANIRRAVEDEPIHIFQVRNLIGMLVATRT